MTDNFEKYLKNSFENYNEKPNPEVWDKVGHELFNRKLQYLFNKYEVKPSTSAWNKIMLVLWWKKFTTYSPYTFNVYYLSSAILVALLFGIFFNLQEPQQQQIINSKDNSIYNTRWKKTDVYNNQENNFISEETTNNYTPQTAQKEEIIFKNENNVQSVSKVDDIHKLNPYYTSGLQINVVDNILIQRPSKTTRKYIDNDILISISPGLLKTSIIQKSVSDNYTTINYIPEQSLLQAFAVKALYQWNYFNYSLSTGLEWTYMHQKYSASYLKNYTDTNYQQQIIDNSYYQYFAVQVLNLDSLLLTGDTVWIMITDSMLINNFDTLQVQQITSHQIKESQTSYVKFNSFECPVILSYRNTFGRLSIGLSAGLSLNYIAFVGGYIIQNNDDVVLQPAKRVVYNKWFVNAIAGCEINYHINEALSLVAMPLYKQNISPIKFGTNNIKLQQWMINLGIKFKIK